MVSVWFISQSIPSTIPISVTKKHCDDQIVDCNLNMVNSMMIFIFLLLDQKIPFLSKFGRKNLSFLSMQGLGT